MIERNGHTSLPGNSKFTKSSAGVKDIKSFKSITGFAQDFLYLDKLLHFSHFYSPTGFMDNR